MPQDLRLSGNRFTEIPPPLEKIVGLHSLYMGANELGALPTWISSISELSVLYLGGNRLVSIPESVGHLSKLKLLYLGDNAIAELPESLSSLQQLRTLNVHNNQLRALPQNITNLSSLENLSLRGNPLVFDFVSEMPQEPPTLRELAARTIKNHSVPYSRDTLPNELLRYLDTARSCSNPSCAGVYFTSSAKAVDVTDFCGKFKVPLLKYLCQSQCIPARQEGTGSGGPGERRRRKQSGDADCKARLKKVLVDGYQECQCKSCSAGRL